MTIPPNAIRGVIFDLDGVLIDSAPCHRAAFEQVFHGFGIEDFEYSQYAGWRTREAVEDVLHRNGCAASPDSIGEAAREKSRLAREMITAKKPLAEECLLVLTDLARRYALALASSGSSASIQAFLDFAACRTLFQSVLSGDDVKQAKPHPEIYERTIRSLGLAAENCVVVEDAVAGIEAARAAGAMVIGIAGTFPEEALRNAGAACVIQRLVDLPDMLSGRTVAVSL